jgi:hypothetical protein
LWSPEKELKKVSFLKHKMRKIFVSSAEFTLTGEITRGDFNTFAKTLISPYLESGSNPERTIIILPSSLTKMQRHMIHKLSSGSDFKTKSFDNQYEDRIMEVNISKEYIGDMFKINPPPPPSRQQVLFDSLIVFMQTNLPNELEHFMNTI